MRRRKYMDLQIQVISVTGIEVSHATFHVDDRQTREIFAL
jgi:hypothetical protein